MICPECKGQDEKCFRCDGCGEICDVCGEATGEPGQNICDECQSTEGEQP